ncbi:unnamed protein product [Musa acuminata subsp. burmannicoides]
MILCNLCHRCAYNMHGVSRFYGIFHSDRGEITKRLAFPHAWVMIHQPASSFNESRTGEFVLEMEELLKLRETLTKVYVQRTGKPLWVVSEDMERDVLCHLEAQAHGIVDLVAVENENTGDFV